MQKLSMLLLSFLIFGSSLKFITLQQQLSGSEDGKSFSQYLLSVGDGTVDKNTRGDEDNTRENSHCSKWLGDRAILSPTNEQAKEVNGLVSRRFPGQFF